MDSIVLDNSPDEDPVVRLEAELRCRGLLDLLDKLMERARLNPYQLAKAARIDDPNVLYELLKGEKREFKAEYADHLVDVLIEEKKLSSGEAAVWRKWLRIAAWMHYVDYKAADKRALRLEGVPLRLKAKARLNKLLCEALSDAYDSFDDPREALPAVLVVVDQAVEQIRRRYEWIRVPRGFELDELGDDEYILTRGLIIDDADFGPDVEVTRPEPGRYIIRRKGAPPRLPAEPKPAERPPGPQPERRTPGLIEPELIRIPAGEFWMGSADGDKDAWSDEKPRRQVKLGDFWIARYPVTNEEYQHFLDDNPLHAAPAHFMLRRYPADKRRHPVINVSWHDALAYCRWLKRRTGRDYTLPSEAEWEKAARGEYGKVYPWGDEWDPERCNSAEKGPRTTTPVGHYSARGGDSPYGAADMAGNVWEWTRSKSKNYPYDAGDGRESLEGQESRVLRGGSFNNNRRLVRCACRSGPHPGPRSDSFGFRVMVWSPGPARSAADFFS